MTLNYLQDFIADKTSILFQLTVNKFKEDCLIYYLPEKGVIQIRIMPTELDFYWGHKYYISYNVDFPVADHCCKGYGIGCKDEFELLNFLERDLKHYNAQLKTYEQLSLFKKV